MATTELHKIPATILSRCQEFEFRTISQPKIFARLKLIADAEKIDVSDEALKEIARSGEGSMRDAQSNFDQVISFSGERIETSDVTTALGLASAEMLTRITAAIADQNPKEALLVVDELISRGQDLRNFCRDLLSFFRDLLVFKMAGDTENLLDTAVLSREEMSANAAPFNESDLIRFFNSLSETETKLKEATQSRYVLEIGLIKLIEMRRVAPIEKILERLAKLENALTNGNFAAETIVQEKIFGSSGQSAEKKTLNDDFSAEKYDFPSEEVPFAISETQNSKFTAQNIQTISPSAVETVEINTSNGQLKTPENEFFEKNVETENLVITGPEIVDNNQKTNPISMEFLDSIAFKMPQISAEDLEHIEDNWLDAAYEATLTRAGDNLLPIKNAAKIVEPLFENSKIQTLSLKSEYSNGSSAAAPAREKPAFAIPVFDSEEDSDEIPTLPENPTEEELLVYAHSHPMIKKALRIFRGKIIEIKKLDGTQKNVETK
jgi:DNA polymerase III gamma/tau subunit